jgi:hypothetical protein
MLFFKAVFLAWVTVAFALPQSSGFVSFVYLF